jgi:hypothetical protein
MRSRKCHRQLTGKRGSSHLGFASLARLAITRPQMLAVKDHIWAIKERMERAA